MKVAIMADSSSGITQAEAKELGVFIAPVPVFVNEELFFEDITLTQEQFYEKLKDNTASVSTSQPNPDTVSEMWLKALEEYEGVVYVPISSGLSETGHFLAKVAENDDRFRGKVFVADNHRVSITQRQSVMDAVKLSKEGKSAKEIYDYLMQTAAQSSIYIMVDTLKFLKKSGRLTPAVAAIGTLLKIKPVLQIQGEKLDQFTKVRKVTDAKTAMINAIKKDFETRFKDLVDAGKMTLCVAHTDRLADAEKFRDEIKEAFPNVEFTFVNHLSLSVSCHIGPGALAVACASKY